MFLLRFEAKYAMSVVVVWSRDKADVLNLGGRLLLGRKKSVVCNFSLRFDWTIDIGVMA
jgi:hypothetical protein